MVRWRWLACAVVVSGCAANGGHHSDPPPAPKVAVTTAPAEKESDALPLKWTTVTMDDLKPLARVSDQGGDASFSYKHRPQGADGALYFGEIQNDDEMSLPIIGIRAGAGYRAKRVEAEWTYDQWVSVMSGPKPSEIWGVLDQVNQAEDDDRQTNDVVIVHSTDSGKSFEKAVLHKPCRKASFADFVMSPKGVGRITLMLAEKCGKMKTGLYHYRTTDGGKTFSRPQFEPDATTPAKEVPDEEQPDEKNQSASLDLGGALR